MLVRGAAKLSRRPSGRRTYKPIDFEGSISCYSSAAPSWSVSGGTVDAPPETGLIIGPVAPRPTWLLQWAPQHGDARRLAVRYFPKCGRAREPRDSKAFVVPAAISPPIHDAMHVRPGHLSLDPSNHRDVVEIIFLVIRQLVDFLRLRPLAVVRPWKTSLHWREGVVPWWLLSSLEPA